MTAQVGAPPSALPVAAPTARTADYAIQGFLYQFNRTILAILAAKEDATITVEGIVEDIDVWAGRSCTAIQCKYHESTTFTASKVYKPLLQMMQHFDAHSDLDVTYVLYAHFADGAPTEIDKTVIEGALATSDKTLSGIAASLAGRVDVDRFLGRFRLEIGSTFDALVLDVHGGLVHAGFARPDVQAIAYPNALHLIGELARKHEPLARAVSRAQLLAYLQSMRSTAVSYWTLSEKTRDHVLAARRRQLKERLAPNAKARVIVVDPGSVTDFAEECVLFIASFVDAYFSKPAHLHVPTFCFNVSDKELNSIFQRLKAKEILPLDGVEGGHYDATRFWREPGLVTERSVGRRREFDVRLLGWANRGEIADNGIDQVFAVGPDDLAIPKPRDATVDVLGVTKITDLSYLFGMKNDHT